MSTRRRLLARCSAPCPMLTGAPKLLSVAAIALDAHTWDTGLRKLLQLRRSTLSIQSLMIVALVNAEEVLVRQRRTEVVSDCVGCGPG
eukprot:m.39851 g.39851  ORF g.39851 m.39851 type:complete len:88 (+) comp8013_c0_seq1:814-1077(+)